MVDAARTDTSEFSGEELIREIRANEAERNRTFFRALTIFCSIPIGITTALWLLAVFTQ